VRRSRFQRRLKLALGTQGRAERTMRAGKRYRAVIFDMDGLMLEPNGLR
jgi:hypothetical protein